MKYSLDEVTEAIIAACAYTIFNSDAPDDDKAIMTAVVDYLNPNFMDKLVGEMKLPEEVQ